MRKRKLITVALVALSACRSESVHKAAGPDHYLQIQEKGIGCIYLDKVPPETVLSEAKSLNGKTHFCAYKVGFEDSVLVTDKQQLLDKGKYYQYDMEKDWVMLHGGDSLRPVFFQPVTKHAMQLNEGVLIYEVPAGIEPDTLIYNDSYGFWGRHIILLNK